VRLHLPFYNNKILLHLIEEMNMNPNLVVKNLDDISSKNTKDKYRKIGNFIFGFPDSVKIILLGQTGSMILPIPWDTKILYTKGISENKSKTYRRLGYTEKKEKEVFHIIERVINGHTKHTCSITTRDGNNMRFDVYRLWFYSNDIKPIQFELWNVIEYVYGVDNYKDLEKTKLWGSRITLKNIANNKQHAERLMNAHVDLPIIMMMNKGMPVLLDGNHRLLKAVILKKKHIYVKMLDNKILKKAEIHPTK